jgi:hypothetical protein
MAGLFDDLVESEEPKVNLSPGLFDDLVESEESEQSVLGSIARGTGAGLVNIPQGIAELGVMGLETAGVVDEGSQEATTEWFVNAKDSLGLVPERAAGKVVEQVVNYGSAAIPVLGWVSKAGKASVALKTGAALPVAKTWFGRSAINFGKKSNLPRTRTGRAVLATAGTGAADFFVSPSTNSTLADSWDAMPEGLQTESEEGLTGKALTAVRFSNKFKLGVEGAMFNAAGEVLLPVVGGVVRSAAMVPGVPALARGLSTGLDFLGDKLTKVPFIKKYLTPDGFTPPELATAIRTAEGLTETEQTIASLTLSKYDSAIKKAISSQKIKRGGKPAAVQRAYNDTFDYLTGSITPKDFTSTYGKKATEAADDMRLQIDDLSSKFKESIDTIPSLSDAQRQLLKEQFDTNQGSYIQRAYELHLKPETFNTPVADLPQYSAALREVSNYIQKKYPSLSPDEVADRAVKQIDKIFNEDMVTTAITPKALAAQAKFAKKMGVTDRSGRASLYRLSEGMLETRSGLLDDAPMLREMMGEIRDPRQAFLRTIDNISSTMASQKVYDTVSGGIAPGQIIARNAKPLSEAVARINNLERPAVVDGTTVLTRADAKMLTDAGYVKAGTMGNVDPKTGLNENPFGGNFGSLSGNYVPAEIYNSLTTPVRAYSGAQDALAVALQLKGVSQMSKTVLNPLSQVRNFISNTFVVGANGLIGRNMGLLESAEVLLANAIDSPEQYKLLRALADEGTIGQNLQLKELTGLLQEQVEDGVSARLGNAAGALKKTKLGAPVRFMEKTYKAGDDYWKVVGALGEKARYGAAFRKANLDIENLSPAVQDALASSGLAQRTSSVAGTDFANMMMTDIVRQTMPTYSMVPEAIKQLRRIPIMGNFMAFPAEIIRTSGNIVNRGIKEMGFKATPELIAAMGKPQAEAFARQIRGIGAQRVSGYVSMAIYAPRAIKSSIHSALGITEAQDEVLQQNKAPWASGSQVSYITKPDEKGEAEYIDLSYMLPYEFMLVPARAAMAEYHAKGAVDAGAIETAGAAAFAGLSKLLEPFASEGLAAERIIDVTKRQGRTQSGAEIYEPAEPIGDRLGKSIQHVLGSFLPGIIEQFTTVKGGEFVQGRTARAFTGLYGKQGESYSPAEEAGTLLTGVRGLKLSVPKSLGFAGGEYSSLRSSAVQIFTKIADDNDVTEEDVVNAYIKSNQARRRVQAELKVKVDAAMNAGMDRASVFRAFQNTGVSAKELSAIIDNRYIPPKISRALIREVNNEVNIKKENRILQRLPMKELIDVRRSLMNSSIIGNAEETFVPQPVISEEFVPQPINNNVEPETFLGNATETISNVTDSIAETSNKAFDRVKTFVPSLLGDRANQEIADRARDNQ